ncbi:nucleoside deaminase [Populibacterium corticicola]|uniref:tRNA-specific adenosine deaminase n=1 Tax=Populibacterium corticicola TaxID=1812826 RepID=A0ABW5XC83_9MICO
MTLPISVPRAHWHEPMGRALQEARRALGDDTPASPAPDVPIGAVVLDSSSRIIGRGYNTRERDNDPTGHAEVNAIREAAQHLGSWRLDDCTLVVTLEPCAMCAGTILLSRIPRLVIGAWDLKAGATGSVWDIVRDARMNHFTEVISGVREAECARLLRDFFESRRP